MRTSSRFLEAFTAEPRTQSVRRFSEVSRDRKA
jgi:hypothetical protein